jgi:phage shock protein C
MVAGVVGGLAAFYDLPSDRVRVVYVILSLLSAAFPGILVYLVLWFIIPYED